MKSSLVNGRILGGLGAVVLAAILAGCASSGGKSEAPDGATAPGKSASSAGSNRFKADDGRVVDIGKSTVAADGTRYANPHFERGTVWVASGFQFQGYDVLYITPPASTAKFNEKNAEEVKVHELAKERIPAEFAQRLTSKSAFPSVVTRESEVPAGARVLRLETTLTEFTKGGGAARYFAGLYGAGQPVLRLAGSFKDGDRTLCRFEGRRSGASAAGRMVGGFMKDEDVQIEDIRSLAIDLTDFVCAVAGKYEAR